MNLKTLAAALLIGASSTAAMAADLPSRRVAPAPAVVAPVFTWTGLYAGLQLGYGWDKITANYTFGPAVSTNRGGVIGGGHLGYLFQAGPAVLGAEADLEGTSFRGNLLRSSLRARAGLTFDRTLAYVTGGVAFARNAYNISGFDVSSTRIGWTAGAGVECAIMPNVSARLEYRYSDFGKVNSILLPGNVGRTEHAVRLGVSYHFNTAAGPVVAKY